MQHSQTWYLQKLLSYETTEETEKSSFLGQLNLCFHKSTSLTNLLSHWIISLYISTFKSGTLTHRSPQKASGGCCWWTWTDGRCVYYDLPSERIEPNRSCLIRRSLVCRQAQRGIQVAKLGVRWRKPPRRKRDWSGHPLSNLTTLDFGRICKHQETRPGASSTHIMRTLRLLGNDGAVRQCVRNQTSRPTDLEMRLASACLVLEVDSHVIIYR